MNKEIINIVKEIAKNLGDYADVKRIVGNKNNVRVWGSKNYRDGNHLH